MNNTFPTEDMEMTHILVISDLEKSKVFYKDILGAEVYREYGDTSCVINFNGSWILLVTGGKPTKDKAEVTFAPPSDSKIVNHSFTIRVKDCNKSYEILKSRGAKFHSPPTDWGSEIRCFFSDPDGYLFEISQIS
ncbi:MAG: VOC family protein [Promethearchaeota archaeon]|jgi:catechol 2,3-dioxygenase-like lactoylglutathione lyase family enzyme